MKVMKTSFEDVDDSLQLSSAVAAADNYEDEDNTSANQTADETS